MVFVMLRALRTAACVLVVAAATMGGRIDSAPAFEPRVEDGLFGINVPLLVPMAWHNPSASQTHLHALGQSEIDWVRADITWAGVEPAPPVGSVHTYAWTYFDNFFRQAANAGLTVAPVVGGPPVWARSNITCGTRSAPAGSRASDYGAFVRAAVERYGQGGAFWRANPGLPQHPIERIELGNEPNWGGYWCPTPEPEVYAQYAHAGAQGAHSADGRIEVATGGLVTLRDDELRFGVVHGMATDRFLARMVAAVPELAQELDSIALHLYDQDPDVNLSLIGWTRNEMSRLGLHDQALYVSEFGWNTKGGVNFVSEETRRDNFRSFVSQLARTDCEISAIAPFTWRSEQSDPGNPEHWFGLADADGTPHPSGQAYFDEVAKFEGSGSEPAPRQTLHVCNAPPPDQDGDGVPDELDDYPLDPNRTTGSGETPPPDPEAPGQPALPPRLPADFFGVFTRVMPWQAERRSAYYDSMEAVNLGAIRDTTLWDHAQPTKPTSSLSGLSWTETDPRVLGAAKRGMRIAPTFIDRPGWISSIPAQANFEFSAFLMAYAERYGRNGSFWTENGHLDSSLAVRDYEIWSDVELDQGAWDGTASPAEYASTYLHARNALRSVDPSARAVMPLHEASRQGTAADFIRSAVQATPGLSANIDSVYVEVLQAESPREIENVVATVRAALDATLNSGATIKVGIGWSTQGPSSISESARAALFAESADRLARSDCGIDAVIADSWTMKESDPNSPWDWLGIAEPALGTLRPSGEAFGAVASRYLGFGGKAARSTVHSCGLPAPDRDHDGKADEHDDFPTDPDRFDGTAPVVTIKGPGRRSNPALFNLNAVDEFGIESLECRTDRQPWNACGKSFRTKPLKRGRHTFEARALDSAGNVGRERVRWKAKSR